MRKRVMVVGFLFKQINPSLPLSYDNAAVLLVEKTKPDWQAGRWNGAGGALNVGERCAATAMCRELREQCGIETTPEMWTNIVCFEGTDFKVECLAARLPWATMHVCPNSRPDAEALGLQFHQWFGMKTLMCARSVLHDVRWLVPLCLDGRFESALMFVKDPPPAPLTNVQRMGADEARKFLTEGLNATGEVAASFPPFVPPASAPVKSMCPHCGRLFDLAELSAGLIPYHDDAPPLRSVCPGAKQNPRNPETDRRTLWNGEPNPHYKPADKPD